MGTQGQSLQDLAECALLHDNAVAQYIQEELQNILPDIDIMRMDMDTVAPSGSHEKLLSK